MNVIAWLHYIVALVYPTALPDTVTPSQATPVKKVVQIERVITNADGDTVEHQVMGTENSKHVEIITDDSNRHSADSLVDALVPIVFLLGGALLLWKSVDSNKQVKLAMIDKGMDPSTLKSPDATRKFGALRFGLLLVGTSMGLLSGFGINMLFGVDPAYHEFIVITSALFFAGLSLIIYHMVAASLNKSH
ncbi:MAG: DUF6249 domain-containing protein [Ignavibacteria bacterium]|jgi:hypothetical protein